MIYAGTKKAEPEKETYLIPVLPSQQNGIEIGIFDKEVENVRVAILHLYGFLAEKFPNAGAIEIEPLKINIHKELK